MRPYWRTSLVDGIDDEVADMTGAPEALGATSSNAATVAAIRGGDAERVELVEAIRGQVQPSDGQVVIDAPYDVGGGEAGPHGRVIRDQAAETSIP